MNESKPMEKALEALREAAEGLAGEKGEGAVVLGQEIALLAAEVEAHREPPPTPSISSFEHAGEAVSLDTGAPAGPAEATLERIIDESNLLPVSFLEQGARVQRAVARVVLTEPHTENGHTWPAGTGWGTGFLVGRSLFLTNHHVIPDEAFAGKVRIQFNYQLSPGGGESPTQSHLPAVTEFFRTNAELDYTLVRLRSSTVEGDTGGSEPIEPPGARWGWIPLNPSPAYRSGQHFNIIQHPGGRRKHLALQENEIYELFTNVVRYRADTEPGSSGSPVFNNLWRLMALHHAGGEKDTTGKWINNQGIRVDRIVGDLRGAFGSDDPKGILTELGL